MVAAWRGGDHGFIDVSMLYMSTHLDRRICATSPQSVSSGPKAWSDRKFTVNPYSLPDPFNPGQVRKERTGEERGLEKREDW